MRRRSILFGGMAIGFTLAELGHGAGAQSYALEGTEGLVAQRIEMEAATYKGRKAVRLTKDSDEDGLALVKGADFQDGTIEVDLALKIPPLPPGARMPGFVGIAFRARADASHYEVFYLRPGNSRATDQAMRNHSLQYCSDPDFGWLKLRREWPSIYEAYADLELETWTKVKIEVAGRLATLYLNGSTKPSLIVDGLKGQDLHGAVALWGYGGEEAYFSNLRITPAATPQPIKNGGDAAGTWAVKGTTDVGPVSGSLKLTRDGNKLTGTWSGALGAEQPVSGTWRDGYVEISWTGNWPKERPGTPGNANVTIVGWMDGDTAKGRMKVEGRADGPWSANRAQ